MLRCFSDGVRYAHNRSSTFYNLKRVHGQNCSRHWREFRCRLVCQTRCAAYDCAGHGDFLAAALTSALLPSHEQPLRVVGAMKVATKPNRAATQLKPLAGHEGRVSA